MHGRGGGVYPAKLSCCGELVGSQRPGNCQFSIGDLFRNAVVVRQLHHVDLGKFSAQPLREPLRRNPGLEAVIESDEQLHKSSFVFLVSSFKLNAVRYLRCWARSEML